mmetsp:Transcript_34968/g.51447  ORF Transcript_34968/g.51447 Transcript_34968/m.51447 type:complete len:225 (+) Transcript_34968:48-722(+)
MPLDLSKSIVAVCCSKSICRGCDIANHKLQDKDEMPSNSCAFCRELLPTTKEEADRKTMKRIEVNDPVALRQWGYRRYSEGDHRSAFEYWTRAAKLGEVDAHYELSHSYKEGTGGVEKDKKKELHHLEQAAIGGHPKARYVLGCVEGENCRYDRSTKHLIIAANLGYDDAVKLLKSTSYAMGLVSKEDLASAIRGHQAAVDATKSPQREAAEAVDFGRVPNAVE